MKGIDYMDYEYFKNKFPHPSAYYKKFVRDYIVNRAMIAGRGDEDISIWDKLIGEELDLAKQFILEQLKENPKLPYIRAAGEFRDSRALPVLEHAIETLPDRFWVEKLYSAKVLHDWVGYKNYMNLLEAACSSRQDTDYSYLIANINIFVDGLVVTDKQKIYQILSDR